MSSPPRPSSPIGATVATSSGANKRPVGSQPVQAGALRRRAAALGEDQGKVSSPRAAGAGGSNATMMRLYTSDESPGLKGAPLEVASANGTS